MTKTIHRCELCQTPVVVVGKTTQSYKIHPEYVTLTRGQIEDAKGMIEHALYLGYLGEGSTRAWAKRVFETLEQILKENK